MSAVVTLRRAIHRSDRLNTLTQEEKSNRYSLDILRISYIQAMTFRFRISCASWEDQYPPLISHPFFVHIHFGAIAILGLAAPTYFGAIDPTRKIRYIFFLFFLFIILHFCFCSLRSEGYSQVRYDPACHKFCILAICCCRQSKDVRVSNIGYIW